MRLALTAVFALVWFSLDLVQTDTINIPADYPTIQEGIDAAVNGDTVLVAPGTYVENIYFSGKAITVKSSDGAEVTVIDGDRYNPVVSFYSGEDSDSILEGFSLINGTGAYWPYHGWYGGGINCRDSSPTIRNNTIRDNISTYGAGICCENSSAIITGNTIKANSAGFSGGGVDCRVNSSATLACNMITGNTSGYAGGGIYCAESSASITNNTISMNRAETCGGGIYCIKPASPIITNTIFWDNSAPTGPEISIGNATYPATLTISYSDVQGGQSSVHVDPGCTLNWGYGMRDADPLFIDAADGDFHLPFASPCFDTGDCTAVIEQFDFEGDPRIAWDYAVDMGADEFYNHLYVMGEKTPGGSIKGKLVGVPTTSPVGLFIGSGLRETPVPTPYGDFYLLPPWILIPLMPIPIPSSGVLSIPAKIPLTPPAPYDVPMQGLVGLNSDSLTNLYVLKVR